MNIKFAKQMKKILNQIKDISEEAWEHRASVILTILVIAMYAWIIDWNGWAPVLILLAMFAFFSIIFLIGNIIGIPIIILFNWIQNKFLNK